MTPAEIRGNGANTPAFWLREVALQLAELNQNLNKVMSTNANSYPCVLEIKEHTCPDSL